MSGSGAGGGGESNLLPKRQMVIDLTRVTQSKLENVKSHLETSNSDGMSLLITSNYASPTMNFNSKKKYYLYGYYPVDFKGTETINYSRDLARSNNSYIDNTIDNRYSNYRYAYHYPVNSSNWNKFSRFKVDYYDYKATMMAIHTHDFYSFLSIFDSINQYNFSNFIYLDNSNYKDFQAKNPNSSEYVDDKPMNYHGRNIYIDKKFIYLKVNDAINLIKQGNVTACKYMVIELNGATKKPVKLEEVFSLCNTHAYIVNNSTNKLNITPEGLLANCKATKFGDISDERTILNLSDVDDASRLCNNSNIEDMSMHTIRLNRSANVNIGLAFSNSKIKKLPAGFIDSLSGGLKYLNAINLFSNSTNFETDISKINIPTLGSVRSYYAVDHMYKNSNCKHINRTIISTNKSDEISAILMYSGTSLIEDSPLPDGMFKNYKFVNEMFRNVLFKTVDTFKYIYSECAKNAKFSSTYNNKISFMDIGIENSKENSNIDISGDGLSLIPFIINDRKSPDSKYYNINITGFRSFENRHDAIKVVAPKCKELKYGCSYSDLKTISTKDQFNNKYGGLFLGYNDLQLSSFDDRSEVPAFFKVNIPSNTALDLFREIRFMLISDDYYHLYNKIFKGIFEQNLAPKNNRGMNTTAVLFSNTNNTVEMISLDELKKDKYTGVLLSRYITDSACAIVNTNGKNLKWTLSKYHYDLYNNKYEYNIFDAYRYYAYISVFNNAGYLRRAILAQMYFTKSFENEKIEFIFRAKDIESLKEFMALMSQYMSTTDNSKPVGRYLLLYNNTTYDSKTDMDSINRLVAGVDFQPYITKLNEDTSVPIE